MKDQNKIDELFRKGLSESEIPFDEAHWRDMKKKLATDDNRRRDIILWTSVGGVAAMLIMAFGWWFIQPAGEAGSGPGKTAHTVAPVEQPQSPAISGQSPQVLAKPAPNNAGIAVNQRESRALTPLQTEEKKNIYVSGRPSDELPSVSRPNQLERADNRDGEAIAKSTDISAEDAQPGVQSPVATPKAEQVIASQTVNQLKDDSARVTLKSAGRTNGQFTLSVVASPDFAGVKTLSKLTSSFNGGLLATVALSNRFAITSGALLAQKRYETGFSNYNPSSGYVFSVTPKSVYAECRVLDIPLNLTYTFMDRPNYKLGVVAGASSLLMLTEVYDFTYQNHYVKWPKNYKVRGKNNHFFSEANFAVSYQRKLNNNIGVGVQPYVQVPLNGVGYGNVRLISAGASLSLNVNLSNIITKK